MANFCIKIAGQVAAVTSVFDSTRDYCKDYLTEEEPAFAVAVTREDMELEQRLAYEEALEEGFRPRVFTDPFLDRAVIQRKIAEQLLENILGSEQMQSMMGSDTITTGSKVDLTAVGYRSALENKVLEVKAPFSGVLYLRSSAMDVYTGTGWTVSDKADLYWPNDGLLDAGEVEITTRFSHQMLYMPYYTGYARMKDIAGGIPNEKNLTKYSFNYKVNPEKSSLIARGSSIISKEKEMMKSFVTMDPEVRAWAEPLYEDNRQGI